MSGGGRAYFSVNGKLMTSTQMTYDDLLCLVEDFKSKHGSFPRKSDYILENNLPCYKTISKIIRRNNKTRLDYYIDIGDTVMEKRERDSLNNNEPHWHSLNNISKSVQESYDIGNYFEINDVKYNVVSIEKNQSEIVLDRYDLIDDYGYRYYVFRWNIVKAIIEKTNFSRFDSTNKQMYLINNLNIFMNNNNCVYYVYQFINISLRDEYIEIKSIYGDVEKVTFGSVINNPNLYTSEGRERRYIRNKSHTITKEDTIKELIEMQNRLKRPLFFEDLDGGTTRDTIGIGPVLKYWGCFSNMLEEVNLYDYLEYSDEMVDALYLYLHSDKDGKAKIFNNLKDYPDEFLFKLVSIVCDSAKQSGKKFVGMSDFDNNEKVPITYGALKQNFEKRGYDIADLIRQNGCVFNYSQYIMRHRFDDGELALSRNEFLFSLALRNSNHIYNVDYYKDINYEDYIDEYEGNMTCDYLLINNGKKLFVEICGFLRREEDKLSFINNTEIKESIPENYRQRMKTKKELLDKQKLDYIFIMGNDLNEQYYMDLIDNFYGGGNN